MPTPHSCFSCPKVWNSEGGERQGDNREQKVLARQWASSNLVSVELQRVSKWVSAAEVVLRVKAERQGMQRGFLKGNVRGAEHKGNVLETTSV